MRSRRNLSGTQQRASWRFRRPLRIFLCTCLKTATFARFTRSASQSCLRTCSSQDVSVVRFMVFQRISPSRVKKRNCLSCSRTKGGAGVRKGNPSHRRGQTRIRTTFIDVKFSLEIVHHFGPTNVLRPSCPFSRLGSGGRRCAAMARSLTTAAWQWETLTTLLTEA